MDDLKLYAFHPGETLILIMGLCVFFLFVDWRNQRRQTEIDKRRAELLKNWGDTPTEETKGKDA